MPKYAHSKKKYPLTEVGVLGKFKTPAQRFSRFLELKRQEGYNYHEIERAQSRVREILKEQHILLPPLVETSCNCGGICVNCIIKRARLLADMKKKKK